MKLETDGSEILVVDDLPENLRLLDVLLSARGYKVRPATSGQAAIEAVRMKKPDLILLDIRMQNMDGFEVCRQLKADSQTREVPVIFITALSDSESLVSGLRLGAVDYIAKPFREEEVIARIDTHLQLALANRKLQQERQLLEQRVAERTAALAEAQRIARLGHWEFDLVNKQLYWSDEIYRIFGISPENVVPSYAVFLEHIHPEDRDLVNLSYQQSIENHSPYDIVHRLQLADGSIKYVHENGITHYGNDNRPLRSVGTVHDITEHKLYEIKLQESLVQTVRTAASIVEMRDPYTAGHQQRVAALARAIALEMNMTQHDAEGVFLAGLIHDIGKVRISSEILNKPGKLGHIEYALMQTHAEAGYKILKEISFPWPIAIMVGQHHERINGSGYPQGITGENIIAGGKILAVADVVEAMSSHRPYRPALGTEAALAEIKSQSGIFYDSEVVTACLRLFHEKNFQLPEVHFNTI